MISRPTTLEVVDFFASVPNAPYLVQEEAACNKVVGWSWCGPLNYASFCSKQGFDT